LTLLQIRAQPIDGIVQSLDGSPYNFTTWSRSTGEGKIIRMDTSVSASFSRKLHDYLVRVDVVVFLAAAPRQGDLSTQHKQILLSGIPGCFLRHPRAEIDRERIVLSQNRSPPCGGLLEWPKCCSVRF
jgi:hypothetical protein